MDTEELTRGLDKAGIPFAPINAPSDLFEDAHLNTKGGLLEVTLSDRQRAGEKAKLPALPIELGGERFRLRSDLPGVGENTDAVLGCLDYSADDVNRLRGAGVVN